ncbi:hypothetical protein [Streptomyces spiralis]
MPALEYGNELFGAAAAAACLTASGAVVTADHKQAADLAERIARDGPAVRPVAEDNEGRQGAADVAPAAEAGSATAEITARTCARGHVSREIATSTWLAEAATFIWPSVVATVATGFLRSGPAATG